MMGNNSILLFLQKSEFKSEINNLKHSVLPVESITNKK